MGSIVQSLIDSGLLEEHEAVGSGAIGKPARPVWFAPGAGLAVSASITRQGVDASLIDAVGTMHGRVSVAIDDRESSENVADAAVTAVSTVMQGHAPVGIGVAVPGVVDTREGEVLGSGQIPGAAGRRISESLSAATGLPVYIDNDSRAQALAELVEAVLQHVDHAIAFFAGDHEWRADLRRRVAAAVVAQDQALGAHLGRHPLQVIGVVR